SGRRAVPAVPPNEGRSPPERLSVASAACRRIGPGPSDPVQARTSARKATSQAGDDGRHLSVVRPEVGVRWVIRGRPSGANRQERRTESPAASRLAAATEFYARSRVEAGAISRDGLGS